MQLESFDEYMLVRPKKQSIEWDEALKIDWILDLNKNLKVDDTWAPCSYGWKPT